MSCLAGLISCPTAATILVTWMYRFHTLFLIWSCTRGQPDTFVTKAGRGVKGFPRFIQQQRPDRKVTKDRMLSEVLYIHVHIYKTGGTTFRRDVPDILGLVSCNEYYHLSSCCDRAGFSKFASYLEQEGCNLSCNFFSYETTFQGLSKLFKPCNHLEMRFVTMIRDPLIWRISAILHDVRAKRFQYVHDKIYAKNYKPGYDLARPFTDYLIPKNGNIWKAFNRFYFIGITEHYATSICLLRSIHVGNTSTLNRCKLRKARNVMKLEIEQARNFSAQDIKNVKQAVTVEEQIAYTFALIRLMDVYKSNRHSFGNDLNLHIPPTLC